MRGSVCQWFEYVNLGCTPLVGAKCFAVALHVKRLSTSLQVISQPEVRFQNAVFAQIWSSRPISRVEFDGLIADMLVVVLRGVPNLLHLFLILIAPPLA